MDRRLLSPDKYSELQKRTLARDASIKQELCMFAALREIRAFAAAQLAKEFHAKAQSTLGNKRNVGLAADS